MRDHLRFDILRDGPVERDLGAGQDLVTVQSRDEIVDSIRLTFTRLEVGNGDPYDSNTLPWHDGGLAVQMQAQDASGSLIGPVSRFDDEGITFRTESPNVRFDVRDVGFSIGLFDVAVLGSTSDDTYNFHASREAYYVQGGFGNDRISGGSGNDYLVGGFGNDVIRGRGGENILVGGPGDDRLIGGSGNETALYRIGLDGSDATNLGRGNDTVQVLTGGGEIRLTLSTLQIGNGSANDSGLLPGEDGGLAVRLQAEDADGNLVGPVSRFDDEGISFIGTNGATFDIRNLPDGAIRGNGYGIARFGSQESDRYDDSGETVNVFQNGGMGNDWLIGGSGDDHLVGLDGNDRLEGNGGDDLLVGLAGRDTFVFSGDPGHDTILTYQPGTDRIDLSAYNIGIDDVHATAIGADTIVSVDTNGDGIADFEIFIGGSAAPLVGDYIF
ncbi:calcium-binding protein [Sphingomonas arenae]|uniref:calcium-binding protein n=1 Tax=Sphingomonas arenae TaxID=2812555 RepID=UPI0019682436|nr:calcium-binding protein [Sphingomonas arenae]